MDLYAATQAFNEAATKAWTSCDTVDIPGCSGWAFNGPARPTEEFFVAISYDGREIARAYGDEADPMSIHFYPTPREIVTLDDFKWIIKMIRGLRVKMCVWLGVSRGLDLAFLNAD